MKICPKCFKSNPDNSKKCFFCHEDIRDVLPYVEEVVIPEEEEDPESEIFEEDIEETETEIEIPERKPKLQIHLPDSVTVCKYALPVFSLVVFILSLFISVFLVVVNIKASAPIKVTVVYPLITFIIGCGFSLFLLWLKALIMIFEKKNNEE